MRIIQRLDMYSGLSSTPCCLASEDNPTIQHLDTSVLAMFKGVDECGQVNHFTYSEDTPVNIFDDGIDALSETQHELAYYQGISDNIIENATPSEGGAQPQPAAPSESASSETP